jgi:DNA mismatch endonuclease, patch repair protein
VTDVFTRKKRSEIMSLVKNKDTAPEKAVRSLLHRMGYRFRLQGSGLPGNPDIVLPRHKKVVFVHGCFWHGHKGCRRANRPTSNRCFWGRKLSMNMDRDKANTLALRRIGWRVLVVWGCEVKSPLSVSKKLLRFMTNTRSRGRVDRRNA